MDEVRQLCVRLLGDGPAAARALQTASASGRSDRLELLRAAVAASRHGAGDDAPDQRPDAGSDLASAVARELRDAVAQLSPAEREAMALRDLLGLSYSEMAAVLGAEPDRMAPLLASARVALRERLRGPSAPAPPCAERDRAREAIARRQDGEPVATPDEDWLIDHLGHCRGCARVHAAMLEAAAGYRAWPADDAPAPAAP